MGNDALASPLGNFLSQLDELRGADVLDLDAVGRLLAGLAADDDFFAPLIAQMPTQSQGTHWLVKPHVPPQDVHNHGHVAGTGPAPYSLILLGDDMYLFEREEYDPDRGTWQALAPGDPGQSNR